jgi:hypothetical protein
VALKANELRVRQLIALTMEQPDRHDFAGTGWDYEPPIPRAALERLHSDARTFLRGIVISGNADPVRLSLSFSVAGATVRQKKRLSDDYTVHHPSVWIVVNGSPRDRFMYRLIRLLQDLGFDKLRKCKRPDCDHLFFKVTRKDFCSTQCQSCFYMRELRKRERAEKEAFLRKGGNVKTRTK